MKSRMGTGLLALFGILGCVLLAGSVEAGTYIQTTFAINAAQEVPANASPASGTGTITVNTATNILHYDISLSGLSSAETAAHIHGPAARGTNAGVLVALPAGTHKVGDWNYPEAQEANILNGLTYINVHSSNFPGGEIRGQIEVEPRILSVTGTYSGGINGAALAGTSSGSIDVSGLGANDMIINFTSVPAGYHPFAVACRKISHIGGNGAKDSLGTMNLWELARGNYTASTTYTWPSLPGDTIRSTATMTTTGADLHYDVAYNGMYHGFTDLVALSDYHMQWYMVGSDAMAENATGTVHRAGGGTFVVNMQTTYSGVANPLPFPSELGTYKINTYTFDGSQYHFNWNVTLSPGPSVPGLAGWGLALVGVLLGLLGVAALLKGRQKSALRA